jgi:hypothetical protein
VGGLLLNDKGERFVNELGTRKQITERMLEYDNRSFWLILGSKSAEKIENLAKIYVNRGLLLNVTQLPVGVSADALREYDAAETDKWGRSDRAGIPLAASAYWLVGQVTPVVHYTMGGVRVDKMGRVLSAKGDIVENLFAVGEVSGGVHGENRLGGNSLLECTVFGRIVGQSIHVDPDFSFRPKAEMVAGQGSARHKHVSLQEVQSHATVDDCWTVIDGRVYDLSKYAEDHPGGIGAIRDSCGVDSTNRFLLAHTLTLLADMGFKSIATLTSV